MRSPQGRFVLVLGDFGRGKTFLLHELARRMPEELPHLVPLLVELRALEKARGLDELVAQHLTAAGEDRFDLPAFRYMLREGRVALLFDGFDELAFRVTYDRAADHLATLLQAAEGRAKVVITSRTQHFVSDEQVRTALGARVELVPERRLVSLEDFDDDQLHQARERLGAITSAELYRLLLERWLHFEYERASPKGAAPTLSVDERWQAVTRLALQLWKTTERTVDVAGLAGAVEQALTDLAGAVEQEQAAHVVGSGTLLVRSDDGQFAFVHQSVMEWLVARHAADEIQRGEQASIEVLGWREMSPLMADFLCGLAGREQAQGWAAGALAAESAAEVAKANALLVLARLGEQPLRESRLAGQNLRGSSLLSGADLRGADLRGADLTEARLVGANLADANLSGASLVRARLDTAILSRVDLREADLSGARLLGADLRGAGLTGSRWRRAALVGASVDEASLAGCDITGAALPRVQQAELQFLPPSQGYSALAVSPDAELLVTAGNDGAIWVWDAGSGELVRALAGHVGAVSGVGFSPDGRWLASAGSDGTVRVWDVRRGECLAMLVPLAEGWAVVTPSGRYKLEGTVTGEFWYTIGMCRFEPGELDRYLPPLRRLPPEAELAPPDG